MSFLEVKNLYKSFGGLQVVFDVSFTVKKGSIKAIIGPNGAGKTTLFNLISGILKTDSGKIIFKDTRLDNLPPYKIARMGISRTFQNIKLFNNMTVRENIMVGRHSNSRCGFLSCMLNLPWSWKEEEGIARKTDEMLELFHLTGEADISADSLSFGKQRILEFARAMTMDPEIIILDEPAAGLHIHETDEMAKMITKIRDRGVTVLIIEHDMSLIMDISDEILVLNYGEKIAEGTPREIQNNQEVIKIYLGEDHA